MKRAILIVCVVVVGLGSVAMAVEIETVLVGNPGNADNVYHDGYGGVDYEYRIGRYEVTAGQYIEFLNAVGKTDPYGLYNVHMDTEAMACQITRHGSSGSYMYDFSGRPSGTEADWVNRPVNRVSWGSAARFANWLTNGQPMGTLTGDPTQDAGLTEAGSYDLNGATSNMALMGVTRNPDARWVIPTEDEWHKAAFYNPSTSTYYLYATSSDDQPGRDMTEGANPGNNANYHDYSYLIGAPYFRTVVGEFELSAGPYGTFDQCGNIQEFNETIVNNGTRRALRGGSFSSNWSTLVAHYSGSVDPASTSNLYGFRVAEVPEPTTLSLLALGGLAMLRRRKRGMCN